MSQVGNIFENTLIQQRIDNIYEAALSVLIDIGGE